MEGIPTHPVVVHLPLALAVLLPLGTASVGWAVWKGKLPERAWAGIVIAHFVLAASAGAASLLGESDARRIQTRVEASHVEEHEGEGHRLLIGAVIAFGLAVGGLVLRDVKHRRTAIAATIAAGLACAVLAIIAGRGGAELVYKRGAAAAWSEPG